MQTVCMSDLEVLHALQGGQETPCRKRGTNKLYSVKSLRLELAGKYRAEDALLKIVHRLESPFLSTLHWSFVDSRSAFIVKVWTYASSHSRQSFTFKLGFLPWRQSLDSYYTEYLFPSGSCSFLRMRNCQSFFPYSLMSEILTPIIGRGAYCSPYRRYRPP